MVYNIFFSPGNNKHPLINDIPKGNPKTNVHTNGNKKIAVVAFGTFLLGLGACYKDILFKATSIATNNQTSLTNSTNSTQFISKPSTFDLNNCTFQDINPSEEEIDKVFSTMEEHGHGYYDLLKNSQNCIGIENPSAQSIVKIAFSRLSKHSNFLAYNYFALNCMDKEDPSCQTIMEEAYNNLLNCTNNEGRAECHFTSTLTYDFPNDCIGKANSVCQRIVRKNSAQKSEYGFKLNPANTQKSNNTSNSTTSDNISNSTASNHTSNFTASNDATPTPTAPPPNRQNQIVLSILQEPNFHTDDCSFQNFCPSETAIDKAFSEMKRSNWPYYLDLLYKHSKKCIGKEDPASQSILKNGFSRLSEFKGGVSSANWNYALKCMDNEDAACQTIVENSYNNLLKCNNNTLPACHFVHIHDLSLFKNDCKGKISATCQRIAQEKFSELSELPMPSAYTYSQYCIGKVDPFCRTVFFQLLQKSPYWAAEYAIKCIGKTDMNSQNVVKNAFPQLLKRDPASAFKFATACIGYEGEFYQDVVKQGFSEAIKLKSPEDIFHIATGCIGRTDIVSKFVIENTLQELLKVSLWDATVFVKECVGKDDAIYQSIVENGLVELIKRGGDLVDIINAFTGIDDQSFQALIKKVVSQLSKEDIFNACKSARLCLDQNGPFYEILINEIFSIALKLDPKNAWDFTKACGYRIDTSPICQSFIKNASSKLKEMNIPQYEFDLFCRLMNKNKIDFCEKNFKEYVDSQNTFLKRIFGIFG